MSTTLITGARVIDGTGNPWIHADVVLDGVRIADIAPPGTVDRAGVDTVVEADGMICCPGFIDIQSHSIVPFLTDRRSVSKITQGVTTEILGEGWTPAPFGGEIDAPFSISLVHRIEDDYDYWDTLGRTWTRFGQWLADLEGRGVSVNVGSFLGGGSLRKYGMGERMGDPSEAELDLMRKATRESMEDGAFGVATALIYPPGAYAGTDELVEVMKVVAEHNGVHITHIRSEGDEIEQGLAEAIEIAERSSVATEIYHLKAAGNDNWPKMATVIDTITAARDRGLDIGADMYPYDGSGTGLAACLPPWASADGKRYENLADPEMRAKIIEEMRNPTSAWENLGARSGPGKILLADFGKPENKRFQGRFLDDVAAELGLEWNEAIAHLLNDEGQDIFTMYLMISEDNLALQFRQEWIKFGTDAGGVDPAWAEEHGLVHPRAYGTYPRILGRYVREKNYMTWEDAIRKASSAVADRLGLRDRGLLRAGMYADVVVFDPDTVIDHATYTDPHHLSTGIRDVFVNGTAVLRDGEHTGALPGKRVNGPGYRPDIGA